MDKNLQKMLKELVDLEKRFNDGYAMRNNVKDRSYGIDHLAGEIGKKKDEIKLWNTKNQTI